MGIAPLRSTDQINRMSTPDSILATYDRVGPAWASSRDRRLTERRWLDRMIVGNVVFWIWGAVRVGLLPNT